MWSLASPLWSSLHVAKPESEECYQFFPSSVFPGVPMALLTKKLLTASLHSAGPLFGLATYLDTSAQLPWPGGQIVV